MGFIQRFCRQETMYVWKVGVGKDQEKQTKEHIEYFASPEVEKVKKKGKVG